MNTKQRMMVGEIKESSQEIFTSKVLGKFVTNFEITRDSILKIIQNRYKVVETIDIEIFLDKLSEKTLEVILNDISKSKMIKKE